MSAQFPKGGMEEDLTQLADIILCNDSTGCDAILVVTLCNIVLF